MDTQQLTYFRATARHEHMGRAAEELGISDSALCRSIARLEEHCGAELFDRVGRGLRLNGYGRALLARVDRALAELDDGEREIRAMVESKQTAVTLGFLTALGVSHVPYFVSTFKTMHPKVNVVLQHGTASELQRLLLAGTIDLALGTEGDPRPGIAWRPLWQEELVALVARQHHLARRERIGVSEISREPAVAVIKGRGLQRMIGDLARTAGFEPASAFDGDDSSTIAPGPGLVMVPLETRHSRIVGIGLARGRAHSPQVRAFVRLLERLYKQHGIDADAQDCG